MLFGVTSTDPLTLTGIGVLVGLASVMASLPSSRRATRIDPMEALRGN
jgi:ABC-type lipoprotein release transport system permease subunit